MATSLPPVTAVTRPDRPDWASARLPFVPPAPPGGYLDVNAYLGEWPARRLNGTPPPGGDALVAQRLRQMDALGIAAAAVSRLEGVWLKDPEAANTELQSLVNAHRDRLVPLYTLNPAFPGWSDELARLRESYGLARGRGGIRLHPGPHAYRLDDQRLARCLDRLTALDLPVALTVQMEDARLHQPAMRVPDLPPADVATLCQRWPETRWIVACATYAAVSAIGVAVTTPTRLCLDLSRVHGPVDSIPDLCARVGTHRLAFGTNAPLHVPEAAILELADARLAAAADEALRYGNGSAALGLARHATG
jgi:predicted TIM-barrel fold metal-dependent hydrolase